MFVKKLQVNCDVYTERNFPQKYVIQQEKQDTLYFQIQTYTLCLNNNLITHLKELSGLNLEMYFWMIKGTRYQRKQFKRFYFI